MFFYSYPFILAFLPVALAGFFWTARLAPRLAAAWLTGASLFFYGYWNPRFLLLILASITFNYAIGRLLAQRRSESSGRVILGAAVAINLLVLAYFKYTNFFITTSDGLFGLHWSVVEIALPLGISIFTFTQIAFICDVRAGAAREFNFIHYVLFVTYFPHLIAGPIIHHRQIMPQFDAPATYRASPDNFAIGLTIFLIGLAKKVLLASSFAEYSDPVFDGVRHGAQPGLFVAWAGAVAYTLQIYFDFSGYSDMAIGLSRMFGITLPENFDSPYKSRNIVEFWRRWNMTLSQFLRDYLYIPLGGNRKGPARRYVNLMLTMLLGGLWHGASWTFVAWGTLHGLYLVANHAVAALLGRIRTTGARMAPAGRIASTALTFLAVVVAWVFFRADSFHSAYSILNGMVRLGDIGQWIRLASPGPAIAFDFWIPPDTTAYRAGLFSVGFSVIWLAPNTRELVGRLRTQICDRSFVVIGACAFWIFLLAAISASRSVSQFIYFNF